MRYIDTHVHYDHPLYEGVRDEILGDVHRDLIDYAVIPPITMESNYTVRDVLPGDKYPWLRFAKGLHPKAVNSSPNWDPGMEDEFRKLIDAPSVIAVKTGLDFCKKKLEDQQKERQRDYLRNFIRLAEEYHRPLIFHIRVAENDMITLLKDTGLHTEAVAHCFCFGRDVSDRLMELGVGYFGIGGAVTRSEMDGLRDAVKAMPMESILLETDGPFMKPEGYEKKVNASDALPIIAEKIAELKSMDVEDVVRITYENAKRFYGI